MADDDELIALAQEGDEAGLREALAASCLPMWLGADWGKMLRAAAANGRCGTVSFLLGDLGARRCSFGANLAFQTAFAWNEAAVVGQVLRTFPAQAGILCTHRILQRGAMLGLDDALRECLRCTSGTGLLDERTDGDDSLGARLLACALFPANTSTVEVLLEAKAQADAVDVMTSYHHGGYSARHVGALQLLLRAGMPATQTHDGLSLLCVAARGTCACKESCCGLVAALLSAKAMPCRGAVRAALQRDDTASLGLLLGTEVELRAMSRGQVLRRAVDRCPLLGMARSAQAVEQLLHAKANIDFAKFDGRTPLNVCCNGDSPAVVQALLTAKANVEAETRDGFTPLHIYAANTVVNADRTVKILLKAKASIGAVTVEGCTPLHICCANISASSERMVQVLLAARADVGSVDGAGLTVLDHLTKAARSRRARIAVGHTLLAAKASPHGRTAASSLPLLRCCNLAANQNAFGAEFLPVLLNAKAQPNCVFENGDTPLHALVSSRRFSGPSDRSATSAGAVSCLLRAKADVHAADAQGLPVLARLMLRVDVAPSDEAWERLVHALAPAYRGGNCLDEQWARARKLAKCAAAAAQYSGHDAVRWKRALARLRFAFDVARSDSATTSAVCTRESSTPT